MEDTSKPKSMALASGIAGIASLGTSLINSLTQNRNTEKTNRENRELAEYQYSKELEMWNRANEYNLPSSQMARLKEAGLNPNLVYGSGSASGNMASTLPKYNAPTMNYNYRPVMDPLQMLDSFQNYQLRGAEIDNARARRDNIDADTALKTTNEFVNKWKYKGWSAGIGYENALKRERLDQARRENRIGTATEEYQASYLANRVNEQQARMNSLNSQTRLRGLQADLYDFNAWSKILQGFGVKLPSFRR